MISHWSTDPFAERTTIHGLPSDQVRSALHKHARQGRTEQAIRAAVELARTDEEHEAMLWQRLRCIAADDVGLGDPLAPVVVGALHDSARMFQHGQFERLAFAAQAAAYLATATKDPTASEIMQVVLHQDLVPDIPEAAIDIHTKQGQLDGKTLYDWWMTGSAVTPTVEGRDTSWRERLTELYRGRAEHEP